MPKVVKFDIILKISLYISLQAGKKAQECWERK